MGSGAIRKSCRRGMRNKPFLTAVSRNDSGNYIDFLMKSRKMQVLLVLTGWGISGEGI